MARDVSGLSRRGFLRGVGALAALPYLESFAGAAGATAGAVKPPLRMGIFTVAGGTVSESWIPAAAGPLAKLPSILRPLEPFKNNLLILSNLSQSAKGDGVNGHEHCGFSHLTAADHVGRVNGKAYVQAEGVFAESVDQRAARMVKEQSLLPSMEFGLANQETRYSWRKDGVNLPYENDPRLVFERMFFKGRSMVAPNWRTRATAGKQQSAKPGAGSSYDKQVVDLVLDDANRLNKKLGSSDKHRLGEYLEAVDGIERRIARTQARLQIEALDVRNPGPSNPIAPDHLPATANDSSHLLRLVYANPAAHEEYIRLVADLMVLAFQTDTTRVCTVAAGDDGAMFPGVVTVGYEHHAHTLEHQGNGNPEQINPIAREGCRQIHAWYTKQFAYMVEKMHNIDEGGSTLLDNSMLLYTSYMANGGHGQQDYPVLLAGKAGGALRTGRHVAYKKDTPMANLYVEMTARMGDRSGKFGNSVTSPKAAYDGRLPDLT
ncbi:MAG TPA: DUF1552 domain-containing protein [Tepidisphaeraceae bacterium]|jgi:hypothetical protein|nr:DUF1552 domain-containing protein [Tepidisphaeraceae bacterium]